MPRLFVALCLTLFAATTAHAELENWRAYPNGERTIHFSLAEEWRLLDATNLDPADLEQVIAKVLPDAVLAEVVPLVHGRIAIRVVGSDGRGLQRLGAALVRDRVALRTWPVAQRSTGVGFFDDRVVIKTGPGFDARALDALGIRLKTKAHNGMVGGSVDDGDAIGAAWAARQLPGVIWAEPDLLRHVTPYDAPNDPQYGAQWHLENADDVGDIDVEAAWETTMGSREIVVAIFDTGTDMDHPDLVDNIVGGFDAASGDDDAEAGCSASPDGAGPAGSCPEQAPYRESHGTSVSGIVASTANNMLHGAGVCPDCALFPVRLLGGSALRSLSNAVAFQRAADAGVAVINNSWGPGLTRFFPLAAAERETFDSITTESRDGMGVVLVFAAGNDYFTPATANPYTSHPGVIAVSASTRTDDFACYSNYGSVIAVAGPSRGCFDGESGMATPDYVGPEGYSATDFTTGFGGTSAASPVVAGVAGLVLSANPDLTAQQVRLAMQRSAEKINADKNPWVQQFGVNLLELFAYDEQGFSQGFGYGKVNAAAAVAAAIDGNLVAGLCGEDCPQCVNGRCAPECAEDAECPGASRCLPVPDGEGSACQIPVPELTDMGQECTAECEACITTFDSRFDRAEVCTATCESDDECAFGFDCRTVDRGQPRICVPGNAECGSPWGEVRCQGDVRVSGGGVDFCSCDCNADLPGACPDGFYCSNVSCQRSRGAIVCEPTQGQGNYFAQCIPDPTFEQPCEESLTCPGGMFCIDGVCQIDTERQGCDVCGPCTDDEECGPGSNCVEVSRGKRRCLLPCDPDDDRPSQCPGDSVCADVPGINLDEHCINPDYRRKGICPAAYRCLVEDRCFQDGDCDEDIACGEDNFCEVPDEPEPDAAVPDAAAPDAALPEPDAGEEPEPDAAVEADANADNELPTNKVSGGGCAQSDAPVAWFFLLLPLAIRRRR